ncbi:MAG: hypothetical protein COT73_05870 [Bdellovibrio sp. CG10_big_fil_rev_8_21_14_0_10_47_8]|nr:MAG: hypothetical protein COT73_05870 [Bdellovibrio sp. CG10_big_fil_rev_8_21_14_0_10_47_8]
MVLIPAAGFGTRVGSPEAKELLPGPGGLPLIQNSLDQARKRGWPVHVITRAAKKNLIQFLENYKMQHQMEISIQLVEPTKEWPDSVLSSRPYWRKINLMILPDTDYEPKSIWDDLVQSLRQGLAHVAAGVFEVQDFSVWGVLGATADPSSFKVCEKPQNTETGNQAWGILAFTLEAGQDLLQAQLKSTQDHAWREIQHPLSRHSLSSFQDLTRP